MGGIVGKLTFDPRVEISPAALPRMAATIAHRGATIATVATRGIALGACGPAGAGIGRSGAGRVVAVADADLSNAGALRRHLARLGHAFDGFGDAELVAHAYEEWGDACVTRFEGPFACAVWDEGQRRLLLARDHVGMRPLCYALLRGEGLVFGSEIKALLQDPAVSRECSPEAIDAYLALGYVPAPHTICRQVSKLEAAHTLTVEGRRLTAKQYWELPCGADHAKTAHTAALALLENGLRATVAAQARGPGVAALISGGIASAAIGAFLPPSATAVTVDLDRRPDDLLATPMATPRIGRRSTRQLAAPDAADLALVLAWYLDEPLADPTAVSQYAIFAAARGHAAVALTGHGAATLWAGCRRHRSEQLEGVIRALIPGRLARVAGGIGQALGGAVDGARTLARLALPDAHAYALKHAQGLFHDEWRHRVYTRSFSWRVRHADPFARHLEVYRRCPSRDPLMRALFVDARTILPDSHLVIADRASAAASLRLRHPFLERPLVELAASTPSKLKLRRGAGMHALRALAARHPPLLPAPRGRQAAGQDAWLDRALMTLVPQVLMHERFDNRGIFSRPALGALWDEHRAGRRSHVRRLWAVLMLELWFREFVDGDASAIQPMETTMLLRAS